MIQIHMETLIKPQHRENLRDFTGMNMVVDIGNGTMNVMYLNDGRAMESKAWTEKLGVYQCIQKIRNYIMDKTGDKIPDEVIDSFLKKGTTEIAEPYAGIMIRAAEEYVEEIFRKLREYEYNDKIMKLHIIGGGARIVKAVGKYNKERTTFDTDICSTAKGYEYFCYMKFRRDSINNT